MCCTAIPREHHVPLHGLSPRRQNPRLAPRTPQASANPACGHGPAAPLASGLKEAASPQASRARGESEACRAPSGPKRRRHWPGRRRGGGPRAC